jgi:transcriptional regulator GlxA family with amidase domain
LDPVRLIANSTFHPDWTNLRGLGGAKFPYVVSPQMNSGLPGVLLEVIAELEKAGPHWQECVRGLVVALLARLQRLPGGTQTPPSRQAALLQRLAPALELMAGTVERSASIVESARACHMSLPSFRRNFRRALGCSPKRYQLQLRVHAAAARLDGEDRKIITLALECGFNSLSAFNRNFKALLGVSPQAWRMGRRKKQV